MDYIIEFDYCALFVTATLLWVCVRRKDLPTLKNVTFRILLLLVILSAFFDILSVYGLANTDVVPTFLNYLILIFYSIPFISLPAVFFLYIISISMQNRIMTKKKFLLYSIPYIFQMILVLTTPLTHWHFYLDEAGRYCRGFGVYLTYVFSLFYLVCIYIDIYTYRKRLTRLQITVPFLVTFAISGSVVIQMVFPNLLVISFICSMSAMILCFTLQSPIGTYNAATGSFTLRSFKSMVTSCFQKKKPFTVFCVEPHHYATLCESLNLDTEDLSIAIASALRKIFPKTPIFQLGSLRFAIIWHEDEQGLSSKIFELRTGFSHPFVVGSGSVLITPIMCIIPAPESASYLDDVLRTIQVSMFEAQHIEGRIPLVQATQENLIKRRRENTLSHVLKRAIQNEELNLVYQPIYSAREHRFVSAEALLRLEEKSLGQISASEILSVAEKLHLMPQLTRIVTEQVCHFIATNRLWEKGIRNIHINLTSPDCLVELFPDEIIRITDRYHVPCSMLHFEVTGEAVAKDIHHFPTIIQKMSALGMNFTLDSFTSAFANDGVLFAAPFREVKLSRSFLASAKKDETKKTLLKHVVSLCRDINLEVVAVGVETKKQAEAISTCGFHSYQGFYYSLPLSPTDLLEKFR